MRAIVNFGLVILAGAVVLGLLWGDWNSLRRQVQQLEAEAVTLRDALGKAQTSVTKLEQEIGQITVGRDNALSAVQKLEKDLAVTQQERDVAQRDAQHLEQTLKTAQQDLSNAVSRAKVLEQSLVTTQRERDNALTQIGSLDSQIKVLEENLRQNDENLRSSKAYSGPFLKYGLGATVACVLVLVIAGSAKLWRRPSVKGPGVLLISRPRPNQNETVMVCIPRIWMRDYARWTRHMQLIASEHANSRDECPSPGRFID